MSTGCEINIAGEERTRPFAVNSASFAFQKTTSYSCPGSNGALGRQLNSVALLLLWLSPGLRISAEVGPLPLTPPSEVALATTVGPAVTTVVFVGRGVRVAVPVAVGVAVATAVLVGIGVLVARDGAATDPLVAVTVAGVCVCAAAVSVMSGELRGVSLA